MTHPESRGRPKAFDEDELLGRVMSIEDLVRVRDALEANGEGGTARGTYTWLSLKWAGDPSGGSSRKAATNYRAALARLPQDPLGGRNGRRRIRSQRGHARLELIGAGSAAGALALAAISSPHVLEAVLRSVAPIMPQQPYEAAELAQAA